MTPRLYLLAVCLCLLAAPAVALDIVAPVVSSSQTVIGQTLDDQQPTPVAANAGAASESMIRNLGDRAINAIRDGSMSEDKKKQLFRDVLTRNFDMPTIGRFAMGRYWRTATPQQQQEFLRLYEKMVVDVYTNRFNRYSGQVFKVTGHRLDASGDVVVSSRVEGGNSAPVMVDWRVRPKGGSYRIIDVMVEGVSMAVTQRNDFAGIIQQGGGTIDALLAYLKKGGTSDVKE